MIWWFRKISVLGSAFLVAYLGFFNTAHAFGFDSIIGMAASFLGGLFGGGGGSEFWRRRYSGGF